MIKERKNTIFQKDSECIMHSIPSSPTLALPLTVCLVIERGINE